MQKLSGPALKKCPPLKDKCQCAGSLTANGCTIMPEWADMLYKKHCLLRAGRKQGRRAMLRQAGKRGNRPVSRTGGSTRPDQHLSLFYKVRYIPENA